jgi:hypothetical protein
MFQGQPYNARSSNGVATSGGLLRDFADAASVTKPVMFAVVSRHSAHRDDGKRFVVQAEEKLTAFLELESVTRACGGFH